MSDGEQIHYIEIGWALAATILISIFIFSWGAYETAKLFAPERVEQDGQ